MTKEERKEYNRKYREEHKEELNKKRKEHNKKYREVCRETIRERNKKYYQRKKAEKGIETYYKIHSGQVRIPEKYRNKFDDLADIVFLKSGILLYPHNDLNNKDNIIIRKIYSDNRLMLGKRNLYKHYNYIYEKVKIVEYKKGLLMIPVEEKVDD